MTTREARCSCGALRVVATGEPDVTIACHCLECQRRTGAAFGVGAPVRSVWEQSRHPWVAFAHELVRLEGQSPTPPR